MAKSALTRKPKKDKKYEGMMRTIDAVFEKGVFRPLQKVDLKENERVAIQVIFPGDWQERFDRLIKKVHATSSRFTEEEIDRDIREALAERKRERRGSSSGH